MLKFFLSILIALFLSLVITPLVRNFFIRQGWVENSLIKNKKTHNATAITSVPRGGGIPIFISIIATCLLFLPLDKHLVGIIIASFFSLVVGVLDDIKDVSPKLRLVTNLITAIIVVGSGIGIAYISNPFGPGVIDLSFIIINFNFFGPHSIWVISDILAIIWIIWCMNIVGWATGVDGQLPGFTAISAVFIGILGLKYSSDITQWPVIILSGAVCGAYLGFLPFNFFPQSIMPGYSGKSLAGFFLAVLAILSGAKLATLILLLGIPMIDGIITILRRLFKHQPVYLGDGQHFHHQLLNRGWSRRSIALTYWFFSFVLGIISLFLNSSQKLYVFLGIFLLIISLFIHFSRRN